MILFFFCNGEVNEALQRLTQDASRDSLALRLNSKLPTSFPCPSSWMPFFSPFPSSFLPSLLGREKICPEKFPLGKILSEVSGQYFFLPRFLSSGQKFYPPFSRKVHFHLVINKNISQKSLSTSNRMFFLPFPNLEGTYILHPV
jgi:hypothetical protein